MYLMSLLLFHSQFGLELELIVHAHTLAVLYQRLVNILIMQKLQVTPKRLIGLMDFNGKVPTAFLLANH